MVDGVTQIDAGRTEGDLVDDLRRLFAERPDFLAPESRRNEIVSLVESGLQDISISRKGFSWGIPVPFDEFEEQRSFSESGGMQNGSWRPPWTMTWTKTCCA